MMRTYTLTIQVKARHEQRYGTLCCTRCGVEIKVGDDVTTRSSSSRRQTPKKYHKACYEDMLYIPPQEVRKDDN